MERFMKTPVNAPPFWSTASFGETADTSPMELSELGQHLDSCKGSNGRLLALQCVAETLNGFIAARFVTTLVVVTFFIGVTSLVL
jgi:hypothetical protein